MKKISINHLNFTNNTWLRGIEFYRLELRFLEERLLEIAGANTGKSVSVQVEYFQNQLIIQREQLDLLEHHVHDIEGQVEKELAGSPFVTEQVADAVARLTNDYATEEKILAEMRHAFNHFAAEWM